MSVKAPVLLVDDSSDTLEMYAIGLAFAGFRTLTASDVDSALRQVHTEAPAAVVTDLELAGRQNGWELIAEIHKDPGTRGIPVFVLTGRADTSIAIQAERAGCAAVITKPCLPDELARQLRRVLPAVA